VSADTLPAGTRRALALLDEEHRTAVDRGDVAVVDGVLDLLGGEEAKGTPSQRLMTSTGLPLIYERWWRPALGRLLKGLMGPGMADEHRIARLLLGLRPGDGVIDLACGPGNFARGFSSAVGEGGLVVGVDASRTMLARAVRDAPPGAENLAWVRGDGTALPFRDASFDAACCFAALYLFDEPFRAIDELARVLTPGGRIAILTSCRTRSATLRTVDGMIGARAGLRMFEPDEITGALRGLGFRDVTQRITGFAQFVGGRKPA
jgi:ubiquinone/menaquinone biosynthesis C-methylase UbiE